MATMTLHYNPKNVMAQKTLDYILSLGIFREKKSSGKRRDWLACDFKGAMHEVQEADKGNIELKDAEELLNEL